MVQISKSRSPPPTPPTPKARTVGLLEERSSREEGPVVEKRQGRHSAARGVKKQGREPCSDLWCCNEPCSDLWCSSGEDRSRERRGGVWRCRYGDGIGGSEDVASETAKITSPSARRRSPAWRSAVAFCNGSSKGTLAGARPVQLCGYLKTRGATKMCRTSLKRGAKRGNLDRQNHACQCYQPPARNYCCERQNEVEMGDKDTKLDARRKVLNLRSDISLARKEIISMPRSECRKRIANFRNEGLKNQESLGEVEGSENGKRIALPKLPLLWNSTFGRVLAAFRGVRSFCLLPKPI